VRRIHLKDIARPFMSVQSDRLSMMLNSVMHVTNELGRIASRNIAHYLKRARHEDPTIRKKGEMVEI